MVLLPSIIYGLACYSLPLGVRGGLRSLIVALPFLFFFRTEIKSWLLHFLNKTIGS